MLLRFTDDDFLSEEETTATIGVDFRTKAVEVVGQRYKLSIWVRGVARCYLSPFLCYGLDDDRVWNYWKRGIT